MTDVPSPRKLSVLNSNSPIKSPSSGLRREMSMKSPRQEILKEKNSLTKVEMKQATSIHFQLNVGQKPISPLSKRKHKGRCKPIQEDAYNLLHPISIVQISTPETNPSFGTLNLDDWLANYEHDIAQFDSLGNFAEIKMKEALKLCSKFPHPMNRFRVAVICNLFERVACSLASSDTFKRFAWSILTLRNEIFNMIFSDMEDDDVVAMDHTIPRTVSFFIQKMPHLIELRLENDKKDQDFNKHQAVLQKLIQSMFKNIGSVFQAWKLFAKTRRDERLSKKAAKITGTILAKRGQSRLAFVSWARYCIQIKLEKQKLKEIHMERDHTIRLSELKKQLNQCQDTISILKGELNILKTEQNKEILNNVLKNEMINNIFK